MSLYQFPREASVEALMEVLAQSPQVQEAGIANWIKPPPALHAELTGLDDCWLEFNHETGMVHVHETKVGVIIQDLDRGLVWTEYSRHFPTGRIAIHKFGLETPGYSLRESFHHGEASPLMAAKRALSQEARFVPDRRVDLLEEMRSLRMPDLEYDSSVYFGIRKVVDMHYVRLVTTRCWYEDCHLHADDGLRVWTKDYGDEVATPASDDWVVAEIRGQSFR